MGKKCKTILVDLPDFIEGRTTDDQNRLIREHLEFCPSCRTEAEELKKDLASLRSAKSFPAPPAGYWNTIVPRIHDRLETRGRTKGFIPAWIYRVALPAAAVALTGIILYRAGVFLHGNTEDELRTAVNQMTREERTAVLHEYSVDTPENYEGMAVTDSLLTPRASEVREAFTTGSLESTLAPYENQFEPETLIESLTADEANSVLTRIETHSQIPS